MSFGGEIEAVRREAELLKGNGTDVIIVLSHSGYRVDQKMAAEVPYVDVIVGGHSHTFLYSGMYSV